MFAGATPSPPTNPGYAAEDIRTGLFWPHEEIKNTPRSTNYLSSANPQAVATVRRLWYTNTSQLSVKKSLHLTKKQFLKNLSRQSAHEMKGEGQPSPAVDSTSQNSLPKYSLKTVLESLKTSWKMYSAVYEARKAQTVFFVP